ncbi:MAG: TIGR03936 family radical SAM-associated protein [Planctomycetota bacterium]
MRLTAPPFADTLSGVKDPGEPPHFTQKHRAASLRVCYFAGSIYELGWLPCRIDVAPPGGAECRGCWTARERPPGGFGTRGAEEDCAVVARSDRTESFLSQVKQNIRIRFSKQGDIRFISHHDLMRLFERALRRADLPVALSQGHNPRPRFSFPMALSVGLCGRNEVADVGLSRWMRPGEFRTCLEAELPEGIGIVSVEITRTNPDRQPTELAYLVPLLPGHSLICGAVRDFLARQEATVERERKSGVKQVEVRQFVKALRHEGDSLRMLLRYTDRGTARPQEVMAALGCREGVDYLQGQIERTHVNLSSAR